MAEPDNTLMSHLGAIVFNFSSLEASLWAFVARLVSSDHDIWNIVIASMSFQHKLEVFSAIMRSKFAHIDNVEDLVKRLIQVEKDRNIILHSTYFFTPLTSSPRRVKSSARIKNGLSFSVENMDNKKFIEISNNISDTVDQIQKMQKITFPQETIHLHVR